MQGHLSQERRYAFSSFRGQQGPDRRQQIAHRGIQANAPGRIALRTRFSAIRPDPSIYERHREWDIERAFRAVKSGDLDVRPIHHRRAHRVRAHVFLCMLAYYVVWHMKRDLAPMLFKDDDPAAAAAQRSSPVSKAKVSPAAREKALHKRTEDGQPVHSFHTLLQDLANLTRNTVRFGDALPTTILARPTPTQTRAFNLLGLKIAA